MNLRSGFAHIVIVGVVVVIAIAGIFLYSNNQDTKTNKDPANESLAQKVQNIVNPTPTPTPDPFEDLTIPYLRERNFKSELTELRQYSQSASYTSYLTSYDSDGLNINGLLTIPDGEAPDGGWPAVVFVHGYIAPTIYSTTERYDDYINYIARNEFVVFKIDLRGHGKSEGVPSGAYYSGDYVIDTLNARAALASSDFVNPNKIGLWGHSMAGNVTFRSMVAAQNIPAVVIWAGAVYTYEDQQEFGIDDNSYRPPEVDSERQRKREAFRAAHGSYTKGDEFWEQVVPTNYLDGVNGALQIHHALDDTVVNIGYSRNLIDILEGSSIEHELFEYPSGGHNLNSPSFTSAMQRTVDFYNKHL